MSADDERSELEQRQAVRRQLAAQRELISSRLASGSAPDQFPRSMTMRLLMRQPALAGKLALLLAARIGGGKRIAMALGTAGVAAWLVRGAVKRLERNHESDHLPYD